jgi:hypothetical protein
VTATVTGHFSLMTPLMGVHRWPRRDFQRSHGHRGAPASRSPTPCAFQPPTLPVGAGDRDILPHPPRARLRTFCSNKQASGTTATRRPAVTVDHLLALGIRRRNGCRQRPDDIAHIPTRAPAHATLTVTNLAARCRTGTGDDEVNAMVTHPTRRPPRARRSGPGAREFSLAILIFPSAHGHFDLGRGITCTTASRRLPGRSPGGRASTGISLGQSPETVKMVAIQRGLVPRYG